MSSVHRRVRVNKARRLRSSISSLRVAKPPGSLVVGAEILRFAQDDKQGAQDDGERVQDGNEGGQDSRERGFRMTEGI